MKLTDVAYLNPSVHLEKGLTYPFVEMNAVSTIHRSPDYVGSRCYEGSGVRFEYGDTVIARITPCLQNGKRFYCSSIDKGFGSTEFIVLRPKEGCADSQYLWYFMMMDSVTGQLIKSMSGTTGRQRINNAIFDEIEVCFPTLDEQKRISSLLSAYDNLIENNRRQIALLEEAVQRLYREWFINLRFPGRSSGSP